MVDGLVKRVEDLLSEKKISKAEVSKKLEIGYSTLWRRLNGSRNINVDFLMQLADVLGTTPSYLMGDTNSSANGDAYTAPVSSVIDSDEQKGVSSFTYWGEVAQNAKRIAESGDKEAISYVSHMLNKALSLLNTQEQDIQSVSSQTPAISNMPIMVGEHNENTLTVGNT